MLHLDLIASGKFKDYENIMSRLYFTWTEIDNDLVKNSCDATTNKEPNLHLPYFIFAFKDSDKSCNDNETISPKCEKIRKFQYSIAF